ncbi:unnamed protein product [Closterium sp. NIES-54]
MYLTLYFLVTRLPESLHTVRDYFLSLDPTEITFASFEKRLFEDETTAHAVAASRGIPLPSFFERCSPSLLAPVVSSAAAVNFLRPEEVGAASAPSGKRSGRGGHKKGGGSGGGGGGGVSGGGGGGGGRGDSGGGGGGGRARGGGGSEGGGGGGGGTCGGRGGAGGDEARVRLPEDLCLAV